MRRPYRASGKPRQKKTICIQTKDCNTCGLSYQGPHNTLHCSPCRESREVLRLTRTRMYPDCVLCEKSLRGMHPNQKFCRRCAKSPRRAYALAARMKGNHNEQARMLTKYAVKIGFLPHPANSRCVDCRRVQAECYDHRDYSKPLEVDPVCLRCNSSRGKGIEVKFPCVQYVTH
jgi:hypothetical protein